MALAIHAGKTGDAGHVVQLVGIGLVDGVCGLATHATGQLKEDGGAQDGRVVDAGVEHVVADLLVNLEDAAHRGAHRAAVPGEGVDVLELDTVLVELVNHALRAPLKLILGLVKAGQLLGGVMDVGLEDGLGVLEEGDLGGGRSR